MLAWPASSLDRRDGINPADVDETVSVCIAQRQTWLKLCARPRPQPFRASQPWRRRAMVGIDPAGGAFSSTMAQAYSTPMAAMSPGLPTPGGRYSTRHENACRSRFKAVQKEDRRCGMAANWAYEWRSSLTQEGQWSVITLPLQHNTVRRRGRPTSGACPVQAASQQVQMSCGNHC
jgi:hypothetical protein